MIGSLLNNRYEILEKVGVGGMAIVYKAKDIYLKRIVAVKVLKEQYLEDKEFIKKFVIEAQSVANLNNQNIVKIYDVGQHFEGGKTYNYIVMEYINGKTLKQLINENGRLKSSAVVNISKQIANALDCAHKHHIIHRDIKPHNILIDEKLNVKVTDFGIARISTSSTITYTSSILGTVHYISPEQAKGKFIDEKSDIYSLGVVMYEMITGRVPFDTDNAVGIALQHINEPLVEPKTYVPGLENWLNDIVVKCMQKDPENRFKSASELIDALDKKEVVSLIKNDNLDRMHYKESVYSTSNSKELNRSKLKNNNKNRDILKKGKKGIFDYTITYIILALVLITSVFLIYRLAIANKAKNVVSVPAVVGLDKDEAIKLLKSKKLNGLVVQTINDDNVEPGKVIKQKPNANEKAKEGTNVELTISLGKNKTIVPDLTNLDIKKAEELLSKNKLSIRNIEKEYDDKIEENKIISQSVQAGTEVDVDSKIDVVVSKGKKDKKIAVPDLIGKSKEEAVRLLTDSGLNIGKVETKNDESKEGTVIFQSYGKGTKIDPENNVDIIVSLGPKVRGDQENVVSISTSNGASSVIKQYTIDEPDKNYTLLITKKLNSDESRVYEKKMLTKNGKLIVSIQAKPEDDFSIYINGQLVTSREN